MHFGREFRAAFCCVAMVGSGAARGQDIGAAKLPEFEIASVRPVNPAAPHTMGIRVYPGGRIVIGALSLKNLVATAFGIPLWQISGGDAWMKNDLFDVEARPSEIGRPLVKDLRSTLFTIEDGRLREMLQALLIDRFQLKFHRESKAGDVYSLERSGKPLRLKPVEMVLGGENSEVRGAFGSIGYVGGKWSMFATTMPQLAFFASSFELHGAVLDRTGMSGAFEYRQQDADENPNYSDTADSFLRWISEVGLRMVRGKGTVEMLVIDGAAQPSGN